mmetsp:Transcript_5478/g.10749  ORF Transcript_5478/g.10749 Transcript_5478/m.10749 type:complete len:229 (+) Transcript_5478:269-955(+)
MEHSTRVTRILCSRPTWMAKKRPGTSTFGWAKKALRMRLEWPRTSASSSMTFSEKLLFSIARWTEAKAEDSLSFSRRSMSSTGGSRAVSPMSNRRNTSHVCCTSRALRRKLLSFERLIAKGTASMRETPSSLTLARMCTCSMERPPGFGRRTVRVALQGTSRTLSVAVQLRFPLCRLMIRRKRTFGRLSEAWAKSRSRFPMIKPKETRKGRLLCLSSGSLATHRASSL